MKRWYGHEDSRALDDGSGWTGIMVYRSRRGKKPLWSVQDYKPSGRFRAKPERVHKAAFSTLKAAKQAAEIHYRRTQKSTEDNPVNQPKQNGTAKAKSPTVFGDDQPCGVSNIPERTSRRYSNPTATAIKATSSTDISV